MGLRDRVAIIRALLHAMSSPQPYAGYGDLIGAGRTGRKNLSEAACYRNWPRGRYLKGALRASRRELRRPPYFCLPVPIRSGLFFTESNFKNQFQLDSQDIYNTDASLIVLS